MFRQRKFGMLKLRANGPFMVLQRIRKNELELIHGDGSNKDLGTIFFNPFRLIHECPFTLIFLVICLLLGRINS